MTYPTRRMVSGALGLVCVFAAVSWLSGGCEERIRPGVADVATSRVSDDETTERIEIIEAPAVEWASGEISSARQTSVASRVLARIEEVRVRAGASVSEGDLLVVLDARDLTARVGEAQEALRAVEARLDLAEREHRRVVELFERGVAPQSRLDEANSMLRAAGAALRGQRDTLREARAGASFAEIRSPVTGRVVDRLAEPGDTAVPGRPLLRIYDPALLRVEAPVRESLAVRLAVGDALQVDVPALGGPVIGKIDEIVPFAERGARTLLVKVGLPRSEARLFAGMFARVAIPAGERRYVLAPEAAIERIGQLEFATVIAEDGVVERRMVTTGERHPKGRVEVLSGLEAGERIRVGPDDSIRSSDRVAEAAAAVERLKKGLGEALRVALREGPEAAIDVCRVEAPRLTEASADRGIRLGRTSRRLRNPANAPEDWMLPLLDELEERAPSPGVSRVVDLGARGTGYAEPIYMQPLCSTCHGENVDADLLERIRERYPADEAVGFEPGELRGLVWAIVEGGER